MICGLVITLGGAPDHHRRGFEYWHNPGALNQYPGIGGSLGRFLAFFQYALLQVRLLTSVLSSTPLLRTAAQKSLSSLVPRR